ncbi:MAG: cytochrome c [candidate division Zixibacteria bacterium]|nr:cytochrome c [candidate division Zixibacteria bacterium]
MANCGFNGLRLAFVVICLLMAIVSCNRGRPSEQPPVHLISNMDEQPKYKAQEAGEFFADRMAMRQPPEGTVAQGQLHLDTPYFNGKDSQGKPVRESPIPATLEILKRGQNRYDIFCSPCHGRIGDGQGMVSKRGMLPPPSFHDERLRAVEDGHIFDVISQGKGNMSPYRYQVRVEDRWAIVAYVRALQLSQNASIDDIPLEILNEAEQNK